MYLFLGLVALYEPFCVAYGYTLGQYVRNIRVRSYADSSKRINIFQSIFRYAVKVFLGWVSCITIFQSPKRRAVHDLVAGSIMVKI